MARKFTFDLGEEGSLAFGSIEEIQAWYQMEREAWSWLAPPHAQRTLRHAWGHFEAFYNSIGHTISQQGDDEAIRSQLQGVFDGFVRTKRVAIKGTAHGSKILGIVARYGGLASDNAKARAAAALYHVAATDDVPQPTGQYVRTAAGALIDYSLETDGVRTTEEVIRELIRRASSELQHRQAELDQLVKRHNDNSAQWLEGVTEAIVACEARTTTAVAALEEVQKLFQKQMGLQAPVQYWTDKAAEHRKLAEKYRNRLIWFGLFGVSVCIGAYVGVFDTVIRGALQIENSVSASLLAFGGLALLTTAALWVARILSRLYLSQHHLAIDAAERATMVTTYLALSKEGGVADQDRTIVLAALFRPTADGIVKDEAPPVTSPAAMLANLVIPGGR